MKSLVQYPRGWVLVPLVIIGVLSVFWSVRAYTLLPEKLRVRLEAIVLLLIRLTIGLAANLIILGLAAYLIGCLSGIFFAGCVDTSLNIPRPTRH